MQENDARSFVPAAGHDWLLPLYDPLTKLIGGESIRRELLARAELRPGQRVLDIGCGTGTLVIAAKSEQPEAEVTGLDPDPKALHRARRKAQRAGVAAHFEQGFSDAIPVQSESFDLVLSSFMFHHLKHGEQSATLAEVRRVLRPGGALHLVDFSGMHARTGGIEQAMLASGFREVAEGARRRSLFGSVVHYCGRK